MSKQSWASPLKPEKEPKKPQQDIPTFKKEKLRLPKSEAKKLLDYSANLHQTEWTQRWLQQLVRERSLPPQLVGDDAYGQLNRFLAPSDVLQVLESLRADFKRTLPIEPKKEKDLDFLEGIEPTYPHHLTELCPHTDGEE